MTDRRKPGRALEQLARTGNRVLRPGDFTDLYVNPHPEFTRMVETGILDRVAHGYYLLVPDQWRGRKWKPEIEVVALGIAVADYGRDGAALMGPAAARALGAIPRALATATVASAKKRPALQTKFGEVRFVTRNVEVLDRQRLETPVVKGWVTTPEQTALDIADRPNLGGITAVTAAEAIRALARRVDRTIVKDLADAQRKPGAFQRLCWVAGFPPPDTVRKGVPTRGLESAGVSPSDYGLVRQAA